MTFSDSLEDISLRALEIWKVILQLPKLFAKEFLHVQPFSPPYTHQLVLKKKGGGVEY